MTICFLRLLRTCFKCMYFEIHISLGTALRYSVIILVESLQVFFLIREGACYKQPGVSGLLFITGVKLPRSKCEWVRKGVFG